MKEKRELNPGLSSKKTSSCKWLITQNLYHDFIIISRFIYQPQSCENHMAQLSELSSSCRFISIFQKGTTLLKMLQDFTFPDFDEMVTNICGHSQHCLFVFSKRRYYRKSETYSLQQRKNKQTKQKQQHAKTKPRKKLHINKRG